MGRNLALSWRMTPRRQFLSTLFAVSGAFAEQLMRTPAQTEGPFYPDKLPLAARFDVVLGFTPPG